MEFLMRLKLKYFKYKAFKALLYVDSSKEKTPLTNKIKIKILAVGYNNS